MKPLKSSYPLGHLLNPATRYVPAAQTDIRETFRRVQRAQNQPNRAVPAPTTRSST